jgi:hypothetical protein
VESKKMAKGKKGDSGELRALLCGVMISGEILPVLLDEDGCIITTQST